VSGALARGGGLWLPALSVPAPRGHTEEAATAQAEAVFDALEARLAEAGARLSDLCKITMQITDRAFRQPVYGVMGRRLAGVRPVSTGLIVSALPDPHALFQLDATAVPGGPHARIRPYLSTSMPYGRERQPFQAEFCMAVRAGREIFLRGQTGLSLEGVLQGEGDAAAQARQAMDNVAALLAEAGAGLADAVHAAVYVTDRAFLAPVRAVVLERLAAAPAPLAQWVVKGLAAPELLMEVDVRARLA
jgi:enamine deaminase RidA (YjgF/YER057c/UK114 family)